MAYVVKWAEEVSDPAGEPYLVNAGVPGGMDSEWATSQRNARRFSTAQEARQHVRSHPWLRQRLVRILRLRPRAAVSPMPPQEPPPRLPPDL